MSELEADFIWTASAELDPASALSLPGLAMDSLPEGTGTGLPQPLVPLVVLWTWFNSGAVELSPPPTPLQPEHPVQRPDAGEMHEHPCTNRKLFAKLIIIGIR